MRIKVNHAVLGSQTETVAGHQFFELPVRPMIGINMQPSGTPDNAFNASNDYIFPLVSRGAAAWSIAFVTSNSSDETITANTTTFIIRIVDLNNNAQATPTFDTPTAANPHLAIGMPL